MQNALNIGTEEQCLRRKDGSDVKTGEILILGDFLSDHCPLINFIGVIIPKQYPGLQRVSILKMYVDLIRKVLICFPNVF